MTIPGLRQPVRLHKWAEETKTPVNTVRFWVRIGKIRKGTIGRAVYIDRAEVERLINKEVTPTVEELIRRVVL